MGEIEYINIFVHKQLQEFELPDGFKPLSSQDKTEGEIIMDTGQVFLEVLPQRKKCQDSHICCLGRKTCYNLQIGTNRQRL